MKYHAFISYRRNNGFLMAQVLYRCLKEKGIHCYLDLEESRSGKFNEALIDAIKNSPNFILVLPRKALDRCKNEGDWVRKEILAAVECGANIIPVMYDGFDWPKVWDPKIPEEIRNIEFQQGATVVAEYLPATIDKIMSYMKNITVAPPCTDEPIPTDSTGFFKKYLSNELSMIESVDMAFHAGAEWRTSSEKLQFLEKLFENNVKVRVLVNSKESAELVCSHMRQKLKKYAGLDTCCSDWKELEAQFPRQLSVRILDIPLLHRLYIVRGKNPDIGAVNIKYYTYGNYTPKNDTKASFESNTKEYELYTKEFDYLWNHAMKE